MGGNIFDFTKSIPKERIKPTLEAYKNELKRLFPQAKGYFDTFVILGSAGKKDLSGDIDLAFDERYILSFDDYKRSVDMMFILWKVDKESFKESFKAHKKRARTATMESLTKKVFLKEIARYIKEESDFILTDDAKTGPGNMFTCFPQYDENGQTSEFVQIDWMVGDLRWLQFSYHSESYDGNLKGLHRTQLMLSMFDAKGYSFNHTFGVKNKETKVREAYTPEEAKTLLAMQYGEVLQDEVLYNYHKLHEYLKANTNQEEYDKVLSIYMKILDRTRADIPLDMQDFWIEHQDEFKLTGKFLPHESNLYKLSVQV